MSIRAALGFAVALASIAPFGIAASQPTDIDDYIEAARATAVPTSTPVVGDPPGASLLWVYVRVPADQATEMAERECRVRDEDLDQSIYEGDPFVVANVEGNILYGDDFIGTTRIRAEQSPWTLGTSDEGWTADDGTRWCRLQGMLGTLPYSPTYQIAFGEKARGPYSVPWESAARGDDRMVLGVDLAEGEAEAIVPLAVFSPVDLADGPFVTDPIAILERPITVSVDHLPILDGITVVAVTNDGRRIPLFDEPEQFSGFTELTDLNGARSVLFEIVASGPWTLIAW